MSHNLDQNSDTPLAATVSLDVTDQQNLAINYPWNHDEVLRITAGPGAGKTLTLAARAAHMIDLGVEPSEILMLLMANRSVDALRNTLARLVGPETAAAVDIATFHSFCASLLDQNLEAKRTLLDEMAWKALATLFLRPGLLLNGIKLRGKVSPTALNKALRAVTECGENVAAVAAQLGINAEYLSELAAAIEKAGLVRYNDLVVEALSMVGALVGAPIARLLALRAVFVDEFQDMHPLLLRVVRAVAEYGADRHQAGGGLRHVTIAGDPRQSIYEFLGAAPDAMARVGETLQRHCVRDVHLAESFRCTQAILDAALAVCPAPTLSTGAPPPPILSNRSAAHSFLPVVMLLASRGAELYAMAAEIARILCVTGGLLRPSDIAVLCRTNADADEAQRVLDSQFGLKLVKISSANVWVRSNLRVYRDIASVVTGESDAPFSILQILQIMLPSLPSRRRIVQVFNLALGRVSDGNATFLEDYLYEQLETVSQGKPSDLQKIYRSAQGELQTIANFINLVQLEREIFLSAGSNYSPQQLLEMCARMAQLPQIHAHVFDTSVSPDAGRSFDASVHHSHDLYLRTDRSESFLKFYLKSFDAEIDTQRIDKVQVSTIHAAKGLEFPVVFVPGVGHHHTLWNLTGKRPDHVLYVAMTRARDLLYVGSILLEARAAVASQRFQMLGSDMMIRKSVRNLEPHTTASASNSGPSAIHTFVLQLAQNLGRLVPPESKIASGVNYWSNLTAARGPHLRRYCTMRCAKPIAQLFRILPFV